MQIIAAKNLYALKSPYRWNVNALRNLGTSIVVPLLMLSTMKISTLQIALKFFRTHYLVLSRGCHGLKFCLRFTQRKRRRGRAGGYIKITFSMGPDEL